MRYYFSIPKQEIVQLKKEDIDEFLELMELCFLHCWESQGIDYIQAKENLLKLCSLKSIISMKLRNIEIITFLLKEENKIVSATSLEINKQIGTICNVMTHPDHRRKGFAKKLLSHTIDFAQKRKLKEITLEVHSKNISAINLYKRKNFQVKKIGLIKPLNSNVGKMLSNNFSFNNKKEMIHMQKKLT